MVTNTEPFKADDAEEAANQILDSFADRVEITCDVIDEVRSGGATFEFIDSGDKRWQVIVTNVHGGN